MPAIFCPSMPFRVNSQLDGAKIPGTIQADERQLRGGEDDLQNSQDRGETSSRGQRWTRPTGECDRGALGPCRALRGGDSVVRKRGKSAWNNGCCRSGRGKGEQRRMGGHCGSCAEGNARLAEVACFPVGVHGRKRGVLS